MNEKPFPSTNFYEPPVLNKKIVVVGDEGCGKTCLLIRHCNNTYPTVYIPSVHEGSCKLVTHRPSGKAIRISLWDTTGGSHYERLRPLSYPHTDLFMICFSTGDPNSLQNVQDKWYPEIFHFSPGTPIILVGLKSDLRKKSEKPDATPQDQVRDPVTAEQARIVARRLKCSSYIECSAKENANVDRVFEVAVDVGVVNHRPRKRKPGCIIL